MRVLGMFHGYVPHHNAGAELTVHALLRHLVRRGADVDVQLSRTHPGVGSAYQVDDVRVHPFGDTGDVIRQIHHNRPDIIVAHLENQPRACALGGMFNIPVAHILHNTHAFSKDCVRTGPCDLAVFNTNWMREDYLDFMRDYQVYPPPSLTIHPAVYARDYAAPHGRNITLINLWDGKGGTLFWELARRLPDLSFLGVKGAYGEQVVPDDYIFDGDIPNVRLLSHMRPQHMRNVYMNTRILLMPSEYESYGRTAIEAACSGIPTIAHPTPGLLEALGDGGTFVDRDDTDSWVAAIKKLSSPRGWGAASKRAKAVADAQTPDADLDRFAHAMEGVVARGRSLAVG